MTDHNHARFRNDGGPWSVCPSTCPESTSLMGELHRLREENRELRGVVQRVEGLAAEWENDASDWYFENRHTHPNGTSYVGGYEDGWDHASELLRDALSVTDGNRGDARQDEAP